MSDRDRSREEEDSLFHRAVEMDYIKWSGLVTPTQDGQGGVSLFVFVCHKLRMETGQSQEQAGFHLDFSAASCCNMG